jgi:anti-sigma-K factor RskA
VQVWRQAANYSPERGTPEAWIINIARSRAIDKIRSIRRMEKSFVLTDDPSRAESSENLEYAAAESESRVAMSSALANLPDAQRKVLELAYFDGLTQMEIARTLSRTVGHDQNENSSGASAAKRNSWQTSVMATKEHEHWLEKGDVYALGALDGEELKDFESHLASGCAVCEAYVRESRQALLLLHRAITPMTPSESIKARILDQIERDNVVPPSARRPRNGRRWRLMAGAIAAGIIGAVISGAFFIQRYEPRHTAYTLVINLLRNPVTRDHPLYGAGPAPSARGRFLWNESGEGHIFVSNLPAAPEGKMYAVWTIAQGSAPRYVGTLKTDVGGQGGLHINSSPSEKAAEVFAVTLEPEGTTAAPTGPIVLASKQP